MKVKILTDFNHNGRGYTKDDEITVDDSTGTYFCRAGWASDMSGTVATGNPSLSETVLEVEDLVLDHQSIQLGE